MHPRPVTTSFTVTATTTAGEQIVSDSPTVASAFAAARMLAETHAAPGTRVQWWLDETAEAPVEFFARHDGGPAHLVLIAPGQRITTTVESCCRAEIDLTEAAEVTDDRAHGIPCPLCHTAWSFRYQQLAKLAVSA